MQWTRIKENDAILLNSELILQIGLVKIAIFFIFSSFFEHSFINIYCIIFILVECIAQTFSYTNAKVLLN